ncbi:MAG: SDR family oxidoreductase [Salinisphaera sp.]|uniref:SDR family oxidoreductase n=1 Tax=Salinisphaera sp. TaxID=1914330 RepID=UPI003C7AB483
MQPIVLITGGSRGIGAATARRAARAGFHVAVNYRRNDVAARAVVESVHDAGGKAIAVAGDIARESDVVRIFETVDHELGRLAALVNNVGILETQARVDSIDAAWLTRILTTNVTGAFLCAREAIRRMSTRHGGQGGAIVNVSPAAARLGAAGEYVDYAASKGVMDSMTIGLSQEVAAEGIRVNAVRPAFIHTDMHTSDGEPARVDRIKDALPMKRGGTPAEVANAILWLMSDEASYTTGTFMEMAGGK